MEIIVVCRLERDDWKRIESFSLRVVRLARTSYSVPVTLFLFGWLVFLPQVGPNPAVPDDLGSAWGCPGPDKAPETGPFHVSV